MIINPDTVLPTIDRVNWKLICANCGKDWGHSHISGDGSCVDLPGSFWKRSKASPNMNGDILPENTWKYTPSFKPKSRECPCGIARVDCDYHK